MRINRLQSMMPQKTNNIPKTLLIVTYATAVFQLPSLNSWNVSRVKVEKVVNPPKRPVNTKRRHSWDQWVSSNRHQIKPIRNEPRRLTASVPAGKTGPVKRWTKRNIPWRQTAPIDPPAIIARILSIKIFSCGQMISSTRKVGATHTIQRLFRQEKPRCFTSCSECCK